MAILDRNREIEHTQKQLNNSDLTVYKATPEQIEQMLKGGSVGRPKGSKNKTNHVQLNKQTRPEKSEEIKMAAETIKKQAKEKLIEREIELKKEVEPLIINSVYTEDAFKRTIKHEMTKSCINVLDDMVREVLDNMTVETMWEGIDKIKFYCDEVLKTTGSWA